MKRAHVAGVLGFAALAFVSSTRGQTSISFDPYDAPGPVIYALSNVPAGKEGQPVETTFMAGVYYGLGAGYTSLDQLTFLAGSTMPFVMPGYFAGGPFVIPGAQGGNPITLAVVAWEAAGPYGEALYDFNPAQPVIQGHSQLWVETASTGPLPPPVPPFRPLAFTVEIVPEPSTVALAALGGVALCLLRCPPQAAGRKRPGEPPAGIRGRVRETGGPSAVE